MKKTHIIGIIMIAVAIGVILTTAGDASSYVSFDEAKRISEAGATKKIHVVGTLKKNSDDQVVGVQNSPDQLSFKFVMVDENNKEEEVYYANPMPQDFLRSEQVVVIGSYHENKFIADKILLKCPSKYQEEEINV